jgi:hypothetical protein
MWCNTAAVMALRDPAGGNAHYLGDEHADSDEEHHGGDEAAESPFRLTTSSSDVRPALAVGSLDYSPSAACCASAMGDQPSPSTSTCTTSGMPA